MMLYKVLNLEEKKNIHGKQHTKISHVLINPNDGTVCSNRKSCARKTVFNPIYAVRPVDNFE